MIDRTREGNDQGGTCHTDGVDDEVVTVALLDPSARYLFFFVLAYYYLGRTFILLQFRLTGLCQAQHRGLRPAAASEASELRAGGVVHSRHTDAERGVGADGQESVEHVDASEDALLKHSFSICTNVK